MKRRLIFGLLAIVIACSGAVFMRAPSAAASDNPPPGPDRYAFVKVEYEVFTWHMRAWAGRTALCNIIVYHTGLPYRTEVYRDCGEIVGEEMLEPVTCPSSYAKDARCWTGRKAIACIVQVEHSGTPLPEEVYWDCGESIYKTWMTQAPCTSSNKRTCEGYYLHFITSVKKEKEVGMELEPATAWLSLEDCQPVPSSSTNVCEGAPTFVITGQEPIEGESIIRVEGTYDGQPFFCDAASVCKFHLIETGEEGVPVKFWVYSSYGDSSLVYTAQVRARKADKGDPDQLYYYVDVLSSQWYGQPVATCSDAWGVFPPVGGPPAWLTTPKHSEELSSDIPYTYLAANLIQQGVVDASECADGGLSPGGVANQCGLEAARPAVKEWQNRFDQLILTTAMQTGVPAYLLKNLFARESQFWPGVYESTLSDVGLGQLTENGADTTMFWNSSFYEQFCPMVLPKGVCEDKYMRLSEENQVELRRALVNSVNATCADCPLGLDLARADFSVVVFAHTLTANCEQTGQVITNYTGAKPGEIASYEDLWKFTLVNYNAGGGCLAEAMTYTLGLGLDLTWDNVSPHLTGACSNAVDYVNDISK
jgi:hypothetical protein